MKLSIIVPCLNEAMNVDAVLFNLNATLSDISGKHEIIVVDDQSDDGTFQKAISAAKRYENNNITIKVIHKELERRGYGAAVKYGLAHSTGEYVTFVSADLVDPLHKLTEMYHLIEMGADLVQCSRYDNEQDSASIPFKYKFYQFFFRKFVTLIFKQQYPDSTYSFKLFKRRKILALGLSANRFNISPEIFFKSILAGYNMQFVSAGQGIRLNGESKFNFRKEAIGYLMCLIRAFLHSRKITFWF